MDYYQVNLVFQENFQINNQKLNETLREDNDISNFRFEKKNRKTSQKSIGSKRIRDSMQQSH